MNDKEPLNESDTANLVAYLDGELQGEAAQEVEARISRDKTARAEADTFKRVWDLLDFLPRLEPSPNFTHRTMDKITPYRPEASRPGHGSRWRMRMLGAGWAAALVVAAFGGNYAYRALTQRPPGDAELVRDLRLIENKRLYEIGENLEFLKKLDRPDLFGDERSGY